MPVGGLAVAHAHQAAAGGLDFLSERHEVTVAAHDHHRANVIKPAQVFHGVQAQPDVSAVFGRGAR